MLNLLNALHGWPTSWPARTTPPSRWLIFASAMPLVVAAGGCVTKTETLLFEPPDLPPEAFEELASGQCPATLEWYWDEYDPWLMKLEAAQDAVE